MKDSKLCINCKKRPAIFIMIRSRHTNKGRLRLHGQVRRDNKHRYCRQCQQSYRDRTQTNKERAKLRR